MFNTKVLYKHENNTDVAFKPITVTQQGDGFEMKGMWFNVTTSNWYAMQTDTIFVKSEDVPKWHKIVKEEIKA